MSLSRPQRADLASLSVAGTIAGRAFSTASILRSSSETITDRTVMLCERYAHLTAMLIATKAAYGDTFKVTRRQQPMTITSELLWQLAPPLVFATDRLVLAGMLELCYDNAATRWTTSSTTASSTSASSTPLATAWRRPASPRSLSAYRHSRRRGCGLLETYAVMDHAVGDQFPGERYVTAVIAQLHLQTGRLTWISAGHPPPRS